MYFFLSGLSGKLNLIRDVAKKQKIKIWDF